MWFAVTLQTRGGMALRDKTLRHFRNASRVRRLPPLIIAIRVGGRASKWIAVP